MKKTASPLLPLSLLLFFFFLSLFTSNAQRYAAWEHPAIKKLDNAPYGVVPLVQRQQGLTDSVVGARYVNLAIADTSLHCLYFITSNGFVFDSVSVGPALLKEIADKKQDAFAWYRNTVVLSDLIEIEEAKELLRQHGNALKQKENPDLQAAPTSLKKMMVLDGYQQQVISRLIAFDCARHEKKDTAAEMYLETNRSGNFATYHDKQRKYTEYRNIDETAFLGKAILEHGTGSLYLYTWQDQLFDSMVIKKEKQDLLFKEKTNIFSLYRGWLEWQLQKINEDISLVEPQETPIVAASRQIKIGNIIIKTEKERDSALALLKKSRQYLAVKITAAIIPDERLVRARLQSFFSTFVEERIYLPLLGWATMTSHKRGQKRYELNNHLRNVLVTISDKKLGMDTNGDSTVNYYLPDVITANDYYPFGMGMPERKFAAANAYRYGFNGKENDNEVKGEGNQQDYGMRIYDQRLGRFLSVDPLTREYPWYTPYQFAGNKPVWKIDLDGLEEADWVLAHENFDKHWNNLTSKQKKWVKVFALGLFSAPLIAFSAPALVTVSAASTATATTTAVSTVTWLSNAANQLLVSSAAGFVFELLNPDPNGSPVNFPGEGDEFAKAVKWLFKNKAGKTVQFVAEEGSKFANQSEFTWVGRLLDEGNDVKLLKESTQEGVQQPIYLSME